MSLSHLIRFAVAALFMMLGACGEPENSAPASQAQAPAAPSPAALELVFAYGSEKQAWLEDVTGQFNRARNKIGDEVVQVKAVAMGSGESVEEVLSGRLKAHLLSPASEAFIKLGNARSQVTTGKNLLEKTENLVLSPVVIAMWKPMAEALGWGKQPVGWAEILQLVNNPQGWAAYNYPQWGRFKFGHTHPDYSNSGLISLFAEVYAATGKTAGLTLDDVNKPQTAEYLRNIEQSVVHYGRSTGFFGDKMFQNGPGYLSAAVLYENMVIDSYKNTNLQFPVVAVYPKEGTFWSDHPAGVVEREWVTEKHRQAAKIYLDFLLATPQQEKAMAYGFRPADVNIALAAPLDAAHGVDAKEPKTTLETPAPEVMDAVKTLWYQNKKHAHVVLVLDTSGSMNADNKMTNAREGALQLLNLLGDADEFSLLPFSSEARWATQAAKVGEQREALRQQISALFASGGTMLYDATSVAYDYLANIPATELDKISAIVVLSDGDDSGSKTINLEQLKKKITFESEGHAIRVFTIGYGEGANRAILGGLADASQAKFYTGKPENIREVFMEISTFF